MLFIKIRRSDTEMKIHCNSGISTTNMAECHLDMGQCGIMNQVANILLHTVVFNSENGKK